MNTGIDRRNPDDQNGSSAGVQPSLTTRLLPGLALLLLGGLYYSIFRGDASWLPYWLVLKPGGIEFTQPWLDALSRAIPSFCYAFAIGWFIVCESARFNRDWHWLLTLHVAYAVVLECLFGTTAITDVGAILVSTSLACWLHQRFVASGPGRIFSGNAKSPGLLSFSNFSKNLGELKFLALSMVLLSTVATVATSPAPESNRYQPVYMSYDELRRSVQVTQPRELASVERVYIYDDYLFLNERNVGLHVIDNRFANSPEVLSFIEIPGNTEVSIKQGYLYADSYVDLVTIDIRNIENMAEVDRVEGIFPYDEYQNIPDGIGIGTVDQERGVVVGYRRSN